MDETNAESLPHGVQRLPLKRIKDTRGSLMETYRAEWLAYAPPVVQWNVNISYPGTLRGFHVHWKHHDFLCALSGRLHIGLQDMRPWSPTYELAALTILDAGEPALVYIPPGVGHGFWFDKETTHIYGVTHYWNTHDELACRWDDRNIKVPWPCREPKLLSEKDQKAGTFDQMQASLLKHLLPPIE
ncbi:dTDP-4-dehydrorhamnose 3,5-epimerase family protein [Metabacillus arenae]|uniref:dTDP-4-dehydrorhamnose 3,5-epimerase family protein n=1 Tax=Metabacillus arenae TaxID=2771434 RepID=A0A926NEI7_9BACI|nr:dTDP-4-dehydrorhamnose 3,5-epimerase family protein [Metabacillus arenae]MBD1382034.1 dTDP-4-dehydrorhamnose 3,5-epimerase family protein [Metabacillus arenae]